MPGAIFYDKDAALRQGISQAGSALAGAVSQNSARQRQIEEERRQRSSKEEETKNLQEQLINFYKIKTE